VESLDILMASGIPTLSVILLAVKIGRWQGKVDKSQETQGKQIDADSKRIDANSSAIVSNQKVIEKILREGQIEQRKMCNAQREECAKAISHIGDRVNGIKDK